MSMSEQKPHNNDPNKSECLSAFIDAEQSDIETPQIIDVLLNEPEYKEQYIRGQLINDHLHEYAQFSPLFVDLRSNINIALDDLPAHFSEAAVSLQTGKTENVSQSGGWQHLFATSINTAVENKMLSGLSVAASVMFVTLFTLQTINSDPNTQATSEINHFAGSANTSSADSIADEYVVSNSNLSAPIPSFVHSPSVFPASFVSTASALSEVSGKEIKPQYQWTEADPLLSRQVRQYVKEHETHRAAYNLQPKIRTATYQINQ